HLSSSHSRTDPATTYIYPPPLHDALPISVIDIAVTTVNAPSAVIQGSTATIGVTVQNVAGQNVTSSFSVVLNDATAGVTIGTQRSEEHTSELQSRGHLVCRRVLEEKNAVR